MRKSSRLPAGHHRFVVHVTCVRVHRRRHSINAFPVVRAPWSSCVTNGLGHLADLSTSLFCSLQPVRTSLRSSSRSSCAYLPICPLLRRSCSAFSIMCRMLTLLCFCFACLRFLICLRLRHRRHTHRSSATIATCSCQQSFDSASPPVGVFLERGCGADFWINVVSSELLGNRSETVSLISGPCSLQRSF